MRTIIFLHGFLGSKQDWDELILQISTHYRCCALDLPAQDIVNGLAQKLDALQIEKCALIGYSMGGRLALLLKDRFPERIEAAVAISSHIGLPSEEERKARLEKDLKWIALLENAPLAEFLEQWYAQPLFASLKKHPEKFKKMWLRRLQQNPRDLITTMREMSLAHQPLIYSPEAFYICGAEDLTYEKLYRTLPPSFQVRIIPNCGHNVVLENPDECANEINLFLKRKYDER